MRNHTIPMSDIVTRYATVEPTSVVTRHRGVRPNNNSNNNNCDPFNDWGGGGGVTNLSPFWEETARKQPIPGTYLTNPLVKCDKLGASLPTIQGIM